MILFDASALLALVQNESGAQIVAKALPGAAISAVNLAEVIAKLSIKTGDPRTVIRKLESLRLKVLPWGEAEARLSAEYAHLADRGFSLGDRACLTQGVASNAEILTADRAWADLPGMAGRVVLIR